MKFSIHSLSAPSAVGAKCELVIGEHKEIFPLVTNLWSSDRYEAQWMESLRALEKYEVDRCVLITDIQPSDVSSGICYWAIFREGQTVYFQERFLREQSEVLVGSAVEVAPNIPARIQGDLEEHARVSEWQLSINDISEFLRAPVSGLASCVSSKEFP
jgi:hypothetical protein